MNPSLMFRRLSRVSSLVLALALAACGDDGGAKATDTTNTDAPGDGADPDGTSGTTTTDASATDATADDAPGDATTADTSTTDTSTTGTTATDTTTADAPGDTSVTPVRRTATFTLDGTATTVEPTVLRSFTFPPEPASPLVQGSYASPLALACSPEAPLLEGGATIAISSASLTGGLDGAGCNTQPVLDAVNNALKNAAGRVCNNAPSCQFNPLEPLLEATGVRGCDVIQGAVVSVRYDCRQLVPSPAFRVEGTVGGKRIALSGIEATGEASCASRSARLRIDDQIVNVAPEGCSITITERSARTLVGTASLDFVDQGQTRRLTLSFAHDASEHQDIAAIYTGADLCGATTIVHTTEESGTGEDLRITDVFTVASLTCQVAGTTLPGFELRRARERGENPAPFECSDAGRVELRTGDQTTSHVGGGCQFAGAIDDRDDVVRVVLNYPTVCGTPGCTTAPVVYLGFDLERAEAAASPAP